MGTRAEALAQRIEQGAATLAAYAQGLTDAQWTAVVPPDGRRAGVIIHHVASVYPIEVHLANEIAAGRPVTEVTWAVVADMNAKHAQDNAGCSKQDTIDLLLKNSREAAQAVRGLSDAQLDSAAQFSLNAGAPLTSQFVIEDHALRHSWHHLAKIKAAIG
jgi:DinB superfamily